MKGFRAVSFLTNFEKEANVMNDVRFSDRSTSRFISFFTQPWGDSFLKGKLTTNPNRSVSSKTLRVNSEKVRMRGPRCGGSVAN